MRISIDARAEEIAALTLLLQGRQAPETERRPAFIPSHGESLDKTGTRTVDGGTKISEADRSERITKTDSNGQHHTPVEAALMAATSLE